MTADRAANARLVVETAAAYAASHRGRHAPQVWLAMRLSWGLRNVELAVADAKRLGLVPAGRWGSCALEETA